MNSIVTIHNPSTDHQFDKLQDNAETQRILFVGLVWQTASSILDSIDECFIFNIFWLGLFGFLKIGIKQIISTDWN
jgi:hypothetical protein